MDKNEPFELTIKQPCCEIQWIIFLFQWSIKYFNASMEALKNFEGMLQQL